MWWFQLPAGNGLGEPKNAPQGEREMDVSIRPSESRRHSATSRVSNLAAATFLLIVMASLSAVAAFSAISTSKEPVQKTLGLRSDHQVSITAVKPGQERLSLTAKLSERGIDPLTDVSWRISDRIGGVVFEGKALSADALVQPGDYLVEAKYGSLSYREVIAVHPGNDVSVSFILNLGGLRILPTVIGVTSMPPASTTRIYALAGINKGELVASSRLPGEIIKVQAGAYRLESKFELGNAVAVSDVTVKPGIMSAVHVGHLAGTLHIELLDVVDKPVRWTLISNTESYVPATDKTIADLVMKPGNYTLIAQVDDKIAERTFELVPGQAVNIQLRAQ
jgi:hypothetical protein